MKDMTIRPEVLALKQELFGEELTLGEVAYVLGMHPVTVVRYCRSGELTAIRRGRSWHIAVADLRAWVQMRKSRGAVK